MSYSDLENSSCALLGYHLHAILALGPTLSDTCTIDAACKHNKIKYTCALHDYIVMQLAPRNILEWMVDNHLTTSLVLPVAMPGIQNFFHKALALVFAMQKSTIYISEESFRRALSSVTIFQLNIQCMRKLLIFFSHTNFH